MKKPRDDINQGMLLVLLYLILCLLQSVVEPMLWGARLFSGQKSDTKKKKKEGKKCIYAFQ